jgi:hypothetical protein
MTTTPQRHHTVDRVAERAGRLDASMQAKAAKPLACQQHCGGHEGQDPRKRLKAPVRLGGHYRAEQHSRDSEPGRGTEATDAASRLSLIGGLWLPPMDVSCRHQNRLARREEVDCYCSDLQ